MDEALSPGYSQTWEAFQARYRAGLEGIQDPVLRLIGVAIMDLGHQAHMNRHSIRTWEVTQISLLDSVFGIQSLLDGQRHGGAIEQSERRIIERLEEQDAKRDAARKAARRWWAGWVVAGVASAAALIPVFETLVHR